jgi:putative membrane-bound dehydrogenase-like protein
MRKPLLSACLLAVAAAALFAADAPEKPDTPFAINTQKPGENPPTPADALKMMTVPDGFHATLFAGEPDVRQPIAMTFDDRGRLWVVENYSYPEYKVEHSDRILIFEDTDGDGRFDKRTVFFDHGDRFTGIEIGFGGVWVAAAPNLLFIPFDKTGDHPGGEPRVVLDGFNWREVGHNIVNGLMWGPDGWLYGRHGILATSRVGKPGTPDDQRAPLNTGVWRYHPTRGVFEVVANGTTNPWGMDYDDRGEFFLTNNVNGHLWHVLPGAHFKRMYGQDLVPNVYDLMDVCTDHLHYTNGDWTKSREVNGKQDPATSELGGGHSHVGALIYQGNNFPAEYRGKIFMCNTHGKRVNMDAIERKGDGFVAHHGKDFMFANTPWFRGVDIKQGPDGGVYVSDWTDLGECHDQDGIHRTSGRVFKIFYGDAKKPEPFDLQKASDAELVKMQLSSNEWLVRHARRILQERAADEQEKAERDLRRRSGPSKLDEIHKHLHALKPANTQQKLRVLWALYVTGGLDRKAMEAMLTDDDEAIRVWGVRLLVDDKPAAESLPRLIELAKSDPSGLVRVHLASAMQRVPAEKAWLIGEALAQHAEDAADRELPFMVWYGLNSLVPADPQRAAALAAASKLPSLRGLIARRLTLEVDKSPASLESAVALLGKLPTDAEKLDVLRGINEGLRGRRKVAAPASWARLQPELAKSTVAEIPQLTRDIAVVFGDGRAMEELLKIMRDGSIDPASRSQAIAVLAEAKTPDLWKEIRNMIDDRAVRTAVIRALGVYDVN